MIFFLFSIFCFSSFRPFSCPTCHGQSITLFAYHPLYRSTSFVSLLLLPPSDSSFIYRLPHSYFPGLSCVRIGFLIYSSFISSSLFPPLKLTGYQWFHSPILPLSAWGFILSAHSPFAAWLRLETIPSSPSIIPGIHHHHHTTWKLPFFHTLPLVARSNTLFSHPSLSLFSRTFTLLVALNCAFVFWLLLFFIIPFSCFRCPSPAGPVHGRIYKCLTTESSPTRPLYAMSLLQYQHCPDPAISSITKL